MFRPLLIVSLTALAAADFTTTMDFREWLLGEDSIGRATEHPFGFRGSLVNIDQNKTTIHAQFDKDSGYLSSKYHVANNSNSFTFTFAPDYISAQMAKPEWWQTTYNIDCSGPGSRSTEYIGAAANTCTASVWGAAFSSEECTDGAFGIRKSTRSSWFCDENGVQTVTWREKSLERYTSQRKQIVLTAGLGKLGAEATEATVTPTATASASPTISGPARETGGAGVVRVADIAMVCVGAAVAVGMS
ncbi:hypothetical protein AG0111_0g1446 [Alternaria gaisen]|uniref:Uncharacterized protein n=1 Tax=Alternaria gaisen TaxID=167740 RepID=A0ACB6G1W2_9PLEO|nr:hypothetical protein AG0111_0g1446 [Alternaria gaisen]